jgi:hypothetical protein
MECLVCYETFASLASVCASCNNAFVCSGCMAQWKRQCLARNRDVSCPKCRRVLESRPRGPTMRRVLVTTALTSLGAAQSQTGRAMLKALIILGLYVMPIFILLGCLARLIQERVRSPWLGVFIAGVVAYLYH